MDPLIDRAALGVTELLSNVHRHAQPDKSCTVELELRPDRLTVSVRDHDPRLPVVAEVSDAADIAPMATCGRGLAMVAAMSESWGARPDGDSGKTVWFTLPAAPVARRQPAGTARRNEAQQPAPRFVEVQPAPAPVPAAAPAVAHAEAAAPAPARSAVPG